MTSDDAQRPGSESGPPIRVPPPLILVAGFVAGVAVDRLLPLSLAATAAGPALRLLGKILVAAGLPLSLTGALTFTWMRTTMLPFRPAATLVTRGVYRFTRNPMYLGLAVAYLGTGLWGGLIWPFVFFPPTILALRRLVIDKEERYLETRFGEPYRDYCRRVPRWF